VHPDEATLSAILTDLEQVARRIGAIVDAHRANPDDPLTAPLEELERSVESAARRLERTLRTLER
jgi:hypothetical protein